MTSTRCLVYACLSISLLCFSLNAQETNFNELSAIPPLMNFSGKAIDSHGDVVSGIVGATFLIYAGQYGGSPLWMETQNIRPDSKGNYTVQLGAASGGLPQSVFNSGEARWLGVRLNGGEEQPRMMLLSVPYALKAGDAATVGGLPPSAFVLAATPNAPAGEGMSSQSAASSPLSVSGGGTLDFIPLWTPNGTTLGNSVLFQSGTGNTAKVGINIASPATTLDVNGSETVRGNLGSPATGTATATSGRNSQPATLTASAFNSSTKTAVGQNFRWQAEPSGNNTSSPSGTLNLLFSSGSGTPSETGLKFSSNGQITFANGQVFPGTGSGTVTSVGSGLGLTGGPITSSGTLTIDTSVVPQLNVANTFTTNQTINGNLTVSGLVTANSVTGAGSGIGVYGSSNISNGVYGASFANNGDAIYGISYGTSGTGVYGTGTGYGVSGVGTGTSSYGVFAAGTTGGVFAQGSSFGNIPIVAQSTGSAGQAILGVNLNDTNYMPAIYGIEWGNTQTTYGVQGYSASTNGAGVQGTDIGNSAVGTGLAINAGVWGDSQTGVGVRGTSDSSVAIDGLNNSLSPTAFLINESASNQGLVFETYGQTFGGGCTIDVLGNLICSGSVSAVVPIKGGSRKLAVNAIQGPENWFEDAGSARLTNGEAIVSLDPVFSELVNTDISYHVFLTPNGDCKGLYVSQKTAQSFIVRELGGGNSNITFDYRIMGKRKGYESIRLADETQTFDMKNLPMHKSQNPSSKMPGPAEIQKLIQAHTPARPVAPGNESPIRRR